MPGISFVSLSPAELIARQFFVLFLLASLFVFSSTGVAKVTLISYLLAKFLEDECLRDSFSEIYLLLLFLYHIFPKISVFHFDVGLWRSLLIFLRNI